MESAVNNNELSALQQQLEGELFFDEKMRILYATDASVYKIYPLAVCYPKSENDIQRLIQFAHQFKTSLIPRTAGTSLGGQVVGKGIIVDMSKYFTNILELNEQEAWIKVQPGVIRDELNRYLKPFNLYFGPETSTANRAMIGGMVGNNSCGTNSIVYGSTRNHVLSIKAFLSDGNLVEFAPLNNEDFHLKRQTTTLEGKIYQFIYDNLSNKEIQTEIENEFPNKKIHRRNTGYAVDALLEQKPFTDNGRPFNLCELICGSEGTLAFITEIKLNLVSCPPNNKVVVAAHFSSLQEALEATVIAMKFQPTACEIIDKVVLDCTKANKTYSKNRAFIEGEPAAILCVEFSFDDLKDCLQKAKQLQITLENEDLGYHYPYLQGNDINKLWSLRKAGLGLLANIPGDSKAIANVEDTAVCIEDLPNYIADFKTMMDSYNQQCVYYAHAGAGELHLRPILNLKDKKDRADFRNIALDTAKLVKKYKGSLSGEHGDGIVRGEFLPLMIGEKNYQLLKALKFSFDEHNIFNPGKIIDTAPMDTNLRYEENQVTNQFETVFNFDEVQGILRAAEKCNGSGDCRKLAASGGTMCPSYMATKNEKDSTRARANILRDFLSNSTQVNKFNHHEIYEVMDLCLSCKGCTSECPSNVDIPTLKAEFLHQYYKDNGIPLRAKAFAKISKLNKLGAIVPSLTNFVFKNGFTSKQLKKILKVAPQRTMPLIHKTTLNKWYKKNSNKINKINNKKGKVYLFIDEFTNYNDVEIGIKTIQLLNKLGYEVDYLQHEESGRTYLSKGLLDEAQILANKNVAVFKTWINKNTPLIGIEPSAILSFRDEYPRLVNKTEVKAAKKLAEHCLTVEEFLFKEVEKGNIKPEQFTTEAKNIKLHGHCHQKALGNMQQIAMVCALPSNYQVENIPSGCCGMAGSFGYEAEHYEVSMQVGELVLFPAIRNASTDTVIVASGTSCRHQIKDGTQRDSIHVVELLLDALV